MVPGDFVTVFYHGVFNRVSHYIGSGRLVRCVDDTPNMERIWEVKLINSVKKAWYLESWIQKGKVETPIIDDGNWVEFGF